MLHMWMQRTLISIFLLCFGFTTTEAELSATATSSHQQLETAFNNFQQGRYTEAKTIWQHLAAQGIATAQINLAALYDSGKGLTADPAKAARLYRTAASLGNQFAQYNLALMYIEGRGVLPDLLCAEKWLQKAATQQMALAQYQLGLLYAGIYHRVDIDDAASASDHIRLAPDMVRALDLMYASGLSFEQETDADGIQKAITAMDQLAPVDPRLDTLRAKFEALRDNKDAQTDHLAVETAFGTACPLENGYVVTNYHVIAGSRELSLQNTNGQKIKAWPVLYDQAHDLALLALADTRLLPPALPLSCSEIPLGNADRYLTTVDIQPVNSGGPLLDSNGEVVGVVTAMIGVRDVTTGALQTLPNQSCAVKTSNVEKLMQQLPPNRQYHHPLVGQGRSAQTMREQLKGSMLVVIAQGKS